MSEEKKWYCSDCGGRLWPTCYYCNEPMTTEDAQEIKAHLKQCEKRPPSEMQRLVEWLRQQAEQEGDVMRNIALCDRDERRSAAGMRAGYMATLRHIRTDFLGEKRWDNY